ncbi:MAG: hypothetical protein JWR61_4712, partial [Ferruginibacter sp.]|uniref:HEPN domain-containing protein n=1 Tax=Ferruginibacter sp. TaxID=1940288 RepID=UPI0026598FC5
MLHQAAEQALLTIFKKGTGLHLSSHNIHKLLRYCALVNYKIPAIFPAGNEASERLLRLLQKAYIEARYKEDFAISSADLISITEKVKMLQGILQQAE